MRSLRRLSIIALTVLFAAVGLAAGERATVLVRPPLSEAAPLTPRETSITTRSLMSSPWLDPDRSSDEPGQAERAKTFAWLLLLLKEQRSAR
jgi:hypothetical protein